MTNSLQVSPQVSVVIPAYNAAETIEETLSSVVGQTYANLDIIVVDDGSKDDTASIVNERRLKDPRIRLIRKSNGGVSSARNVGIEESTAEFVAFLDADDLWHSTKISKQMAAMARRGADTALIYSPCRFIDMNSMVLRPLPHFGAEGWVLVRHLHSNIVANGSAILVRKSALHEIGGYATWLRDTGAEGCEDLLAQLQIAARYQFGTVSEYLVGYRQRPGGLSTHAEAMARSGIMVVKDVLKECEDIPDFPGSELLNRYERRLLKICLRKGHFSEAARLFRDQLKRQPTFPVTAAWHHSLVLLDRLRDVFSGGQASKARQPRHFYNYAPEEDIGRRDPRATFQAFQRLARFDEKYRPKALRRLNLPMEN